LNKGWYICDGRSGTPDLRGRFTVGRDVTNSNSDYYTVGSTGGASFQRLSENQLPKHSHDVKLSTNLNGAHSHPYQDALFPVPDVPTLAHLTNNFGIPHGWTATDTGKRCSYIYRNAGTSSSGDHSHSVSGRTELSTGQSLPIETRPPYYTVIYIVYMGTEASALVG